MEQAHTYSLVLRPYTTSMKESEDIEVISWSGVQSCDPTETYVNSHMIAKRAHRTKNISPNSFPHIRSMPYKSKKEHIIILCTC